jgi:hypothetical protein
MSSIRRIIPGLSNAISRTLGVGTQKPVDPIAPRESVDALEPVRRGFSDASDFQPDAGDVSASLAAHLPNLEGRATSGASTPQALRVFSGESSFEAGPRRYAERLGSQLPSSLGAPGERADSVGGLGRRGGAGAPDPSDILSPEAAAWELQNLDTAAPSAVEPEDLLFMLDPPGSSSGRVPPELRLNMDDVFEDGPQAVGATRDADNNPSTNLDPMDPDYAAVHGSYGLPPELLDPSVSPAGPDEFLADTNDLGDLGNQEPSAGDAALAGVLGALSANPAAASVQVGAGLASRGVEQVADVVAPQAEQLKAQESGLSNQPPPSSATSPRTGSTDTFVGAPESGPARNSEG